MKMRNVSSDGKAGKGLAGGSVTDVSGNRSDDLDTFSSAHIHDGAPTDSVDRDAINQVSVTPLLSSTDLSAKETQGSGGQRGKAKPADFSANRQRVTNWDEWYRILWQLKISRLKQNHG